MPIKREVKKGQTLLYQGEVPSSIFFIEKGLVRALNISSSGEERTVALFGPGDYFPTEVAYKKSPVALLYYESMVNTTLELYSLEEFDKSAASPKGKDSERLARQFVGSLLHINALGYTLAKDRVAHILQYLCLRFGQPGSNKQTVKIKLPLTHLDIARVAGLTRETTAIEIGHLKKAGIVKTSRKYYTVKIKELLKSMDNDEFGQINL